MIVESFSQMKTYLPAIAIKADITALNDMKIVVEQELVDDILSEELYQILLQDKDDHKKLITHCERVISLQTFLRSIPDLDLVLTESGFAVHSSDAMLPASKERVRSLTLSIQERADNAIDTLISFLLSSEKYEDIWRSGTQFDKITAGIISTYKEFKEYAQYSPKVASVYPGSYSEFQRMYANFTMAIIGEIAPYLSADFCCEIIEKVRDKELLSLHEKYVLSLIKYAICAISMSDLTSGRTYIIKARSYMLKHPDDFPTFATSEEASMLDSNEEDESAIYSML